MLHSQLRQALLLFIALATFSISTTAFAATYYVDATGGSDSYAGTSASAAWNTVAKVNGSTFAPGDQILFKRGETWREMLVVPSSGSAGSVITFGAYGTGLNPVITGSDLVASGWSRDSSYVWRTPVAKQPNVVYFDGTRGTPAASRSGIDGQLKWYWTSGVLTVCVTARAHQEL